MSALSTRGVQHTLPVASASNGTSGSGRTGRVKTGHAGITPIKTSNATKRSSSGILELVSIPFLALGAVISLFFGMGTASASLAVAGLGLCAKTIIT